MGYYGTGDFYRGARGDFYRGARGDPGLFSFLGGIASKILPIAAPIIGGALGGPVGAALGGLAGGLVGGMGGGTGAAASTSPGTTALTLLPSARSLIPFTAGAAAGTLVTRGAQAAGSFLARKAGKAMRGRFGIPGFHRRHRRLNPLNPKALRRALRRAKGFEHFARQVLRVTSPKKHVVAFKMPHKKHRRIA
jgi:hypothetical protein